MSSCVFSAEKLNSAGIPYLYFLTPNDRGQSLAQCGYLIHERL